MCQIFYLSYISIMKISPLDEGFLVNNLYAYGCTQLYEKYINCKQKKGDDMPYDNEYKIIEYPGEYNIGDKVLTVMEVDGLLQYIIAGKTTKYAIVSNEKAFEQEQMNETIQSRVITDARFKETMEKYEIEWEIVVLESTS